MTTRAPLRCYYEVLGVEQRASDEEIRAAYKKKSLLYHPDRNYGNAAEADRLFKELNNAYSVLSDAYERGWYDAHRKKILRSGGAHHGVHNNDDDDDDDDDGASGNADDDLGLFQYFTASCFDGFGDDDGGFYAVYRGLFARIADEEQQAYSGGRGTSSASSRLPSFGDSTTPWPEVQRFYAQWRSFSTHKSFASRDAYKLNEMEDRYTRRAAERVNLKQRAGAKKEFVQMVQNLALFVHRRDPRVKAATARQEAAEAAKREEAARTERERARRRRDAMQRIWDEAAEREAREEAEREARGEALDGSVIDMLYEHERQVKEQLRSGAGVYGDVAGFAMLSNDDDVDDKRRRGGKKTRASGSTTRQTDSGDGEATATATATASAHTDADDGKDEAGDAGEALSCAACSKRFTTASLYKEHINSRKHKTRVKQLAAKSKKAQHNDKANNSDEGDDDDDK